ncbi:hypothetical protein JRI60_22245 [Archangium violaceum]|uniref:hypothetical protein n=1 Tax=Archangium violaceum TaxID=83451 RepID=UPI00194EE7EE|nr:hypothetical protein [Archangium violaceum]QRO01545.1 hypothetical protein JRI60_22245 [Archangium violaceum]
MSDSLRRAVPLFAACVVLSTSSALAGGSISGMVSVPPGHDINGAMVVACKMGLNAECDERTAVSGMFDDEHGQRHEYELPDVPSEGRVVMAWKDLNGNGEIDAGDLLGFYSNPKGGQEVAMVTAPARNIHIQMKIHGSGGPLAGGSSGGSSLSGKVTAPKGQDVKGTVIIACIPAGGGCGEPTYSAQVAESGRSGSFAIQNVAPGSYQIVAWKDLNGNKEIDSADLVGAQTQNGAYARVSPPASVNLELKMGGQPSGSGKQPEAAAPVPNAAQGTPGGPVEGAFYNGSIRKGGYYNGKARSWIINASDDLDGYYVRFLPKGRYEFSSLYRTRINFNTACYLRLYTYHSGRVQWGANGQVTVTPEFKIGRRENLCSPSSNTDFTPNIGAQTWTVSQTPDPSGKPALTIVEQGGVTRTYVRGE